jgi:hypothetical protein
LPDPYVDATMRRALVEALGVANQEGLDVTSQQGQTVSLSREFALLLLKTFLGERIWKSNGDVASTPISTAAERASMMSRITGHLQDTTSVSMPSALASLLKTYQIDRTLPVGLFDPAVWR